MFRTYFINADRHVTLKMSHSDHDSARENLPIIALKYIKENFGEKFSQNAKLFYEKKPSKDEVNSEHEKYPQGYYIFESNDDNLQIYSKIIGVEKKDGWWNTSYNYNVNFHFVGQFGIAVDETHKLSLPIKKEYDYSKNMNAHQNTYPQKRKEINNTNKNGNKNSCDRFDKPQNIDSIQSELKYFIQYRKNRQDNSEKTLKDIISNFNSEK